MFNRSLFFSLFLIAFCCSRLASAAIVYTADDSNDPGGPVYNWEDISGTGTYVSLSDFITSGVIPIGFNFGFYGNGYAVLYISPNGYVTFDTVPNSYSPEPGEPIPTPGSIKGPGVEADNLIAGWWGDLDPAQHGTVYYQTLGTAPNRYFIVQYTEMAQWTSGAGNPSTYSTFQIKLFEQDQRIEIHYQQTFSDGQQHSVGVENDDGTVGTEYYLSTASAGLPDLLAVRFVPEEVADVDVIAVPALGRETFWLLVLLLGGAALWSMAKQRRVEKG